MASVLSNLYFIEKKLDNVHVDDDVTTLADVEHDDKLDLDNAVNAFKGKGND